MSSIGNVYYKENVQKNEPDAVLSKHLLLNWKSWFIIYRLARGKAFNVQRKMYRYKENGPDTQDDLSPLYWDLFLFPNLKIALGNIDWPRGNFEEKTR